jgi:WD40 repeat protein
VQLESVCSIPVEEFLLTRVAFRPDGHHIVVGHRDLTLYEVLSGKAVRSFPFEGFLGCARFSSDGRYLAAANENDNHPHTTGLAKVFEVDSGETLVEIRTRFPIRAACFLESPQGTIFLYRDTEPDHGGASPFHRNRVRGCRLGSSQPVFGLEFPAWEIRDMAAGSAFALFGLDSVGKVHDIEGASLTIRQYKVGAYSYPAGARLRILGLGIGAGISAFSPEGRLLALELVDFRANRRQLSLLNVDTGVGTNLLLLPSDVMPALAFCEDGSRLLSLCDDPSTPSAALRLWDTASLRQIGDAHIGMQYHAIALNWPTRRIAALGGGKCDIAVIRD